MILYFLSLSLSLSPPSAHPNLLACLGTTGKPKGAMLSHANIVSCMKAVWRGLWKFQSQVETKQIFRLDLNFLIEIF